MKLRQVEARSTQASKDLQDMYGEAGILKDDKIRIEEENRALAG